MSEIQTHYEGCWQDPKHHACAVTKIKELEYMESILSGQIKSLKAERKLIFKLLGNASNPE